MSESHLSNTNEIESSVVNGDHAPDRKIEKEKDKVNGKRKTDNGAESVATKVEVSKNNHSETDVNDTTKIKRVEEANDVSGFRSDRNGVTSNATTTTEKLDNDNEKKPPPTKGEKSTKKKKAQKENSNGNVNKEDCEKKKRKKKKKKRGGNCDDESTKAGRDGETSSSKDRSENQSTRENIDNNSSDNRQSVNGSDDKDKIIIEDGKNVNSVNIKDEVVVTNKRSKEEKESSRSGENAEKVDNKEENKDNGLINAKKNGEDSVLSGDENNEIKSDITAVQESKEQQGLILSCSNDGVPDTEVRVNGADSADKLVDRVDGAEMHVDNAEILVDNAEILVDHAEKLVDSVDKVDKLGDRVDTAGILVDNVDKADKLVDNVDKADKLVDGVDKADKLVDNVDKADKLVDSVDNVDTLGDSVDTADKLVDSVDKTDKLVDSVDKVDKLGDSVDKVDKLVDRVDGAEMQGDNAEIRVDHADKLGDSVDKADKLVNSVNNAQNMEDTEETAEKTTDNMTSQIANEENASCTSNSSEQTISTNTENTSVVEDVIDTVSESEKSTGVDSEKEKCEQANVVEECGQENIVDNENAIESKNKDSGHADGDNIAGDGHMDTNIMDYGVRNDYLESSILHMTEEQLQQQLKEQHDAMTRLQAHAHAQQVEANLLTTSLRFKLRRKEQEMNRVKLDHEQQVSVVLSHLLYLEGQMQKDHNEVNEILNEKDDVIRRQKAAIEDLVAKNNRYLQALKESHGYSGDNGVVKPQTHVVQQNDKISIQDHGNKVILRGHKIKNGDKIHTSGHKVRFSGMRDILRRHKSSLELYRHEPLETLVETTMKYGSEENLTGNRNGKSSLFERKERCRSLIDYPVSLVDVEEGQTEANDNCFSDDFHTPIITRHGSTSSLVSFSEKTAQNNREMSSASTYGFNELSKSRSVPHGLPTVAENDVSPTNLRGRPHSLPSVEMLAKDLALVTTVTSTTPLSSKIVTPSSVSTTSSSPPSESNPFKTFKNVFKRKGSKKKRAAAVTSGKDQTDALKQHFQKYDMT